MKKSKTTTFLLLIILWIPQLAHAQSKEYGKKLKEYDAYVEKAIKEWGTVGLALTVVKDNDIIFKKSYGVRELNRSVPVDDHTLFACASTTKAMTAVCLGILVDEGKVKWSDPVIKYLPEFQLHDPYVTRELRIRDLLVHNSGVGNTDFLWSYMDIPSEEVLHRMKWVEPSYSFRSGFIYQNIFYLAAGQVIEKITGQPWEEFISQKVFVPLGMSHTVPLLQKIKNTNKTKPHMLVDNQMMVIEDLSADAIGPAGSVWSCIDDMSKWAKCMLDSAKFAGGRLITKETWLEMMKPQTIIPSTAFYPTAQLTKPNWMTYGLGWFQHDYKGRKINFHTGSLPGSIAIHGQIPQERIAVYVFGNTDHVEVRHALMYKAFDLFALGGSTDWSSDFLKLYNELKEKDEGEQKQQKASRIENTVPSLTLNAYSGTYQDDLYGKITIEVKNDQLEMNINGKNKAILSHWHHDTFRGSMEKKWYGEVTAQFQMDKNGKVSSISLDGMILKKAG